MISNLTFKRIYRCLTCKSIGGPVTNITWQKNGQTLNIDGTKYTQVQEINNTETAIYINTLLARDVVDFVGSFTCTVMNERGQSSKSLVLGGV